MKDVEEKIRKCLELSKGSRTPEESEAALLAAQRLAMRSGLDLAEVMSRGDKPDLGKVVKYVYDLGGSRIYPATLYIWDILEAHFNVSILISKKMDSNRVLIIFGREEDTQYAGWVYSFLEEEMQRRWDIERPKNGLGIYQRDSFYKGIYLSLMKKLDNSRVEEEDKEKRRLYIEGQGSSALILSKNMIVLRGMELEERKKKMKECFPNLGTVKYSGKVESETSLEIGKRVGREINISRPVKGSSNLRLT